MPLNYFFQKFHACLYYTMHHVPVIGVEHQNSNGTYLGFLYIHGPLFLLYKQVSRHCFVFFIFPLCVTIKVSYWVFFSTIFFNNLKMIQVTDYFDSCDYYLFLVFPHQFKRSVHCIVKRSNSNIFDRNFARQMYQRVVVLLNINLGGFWNVSKQRTEMLVFDKNWIWEGWNEIFSHPNEGQEVY